MVAAVLPWLAGCFADPPVQTSLGLPAGTSAPGPQGCSGEGGPPALAPGGYYTRGAQVCTAAGQSHVFHGVDRPSLEWSIMGEAFSLSDFQNMAAWHANVVRIALNQDFWLSGATLYDARYATYVDTYVSWAEEAGLDVILDLHWSDRGDLTVAKTQGSQNTPGYAAQQEMADVNSIEFWSEVATRYKGDGHVLFELYNEPNGITWDVWLNGGMSGGASPFQVAGMQKLYDTVRGTGAENVVIAGGLHWAFDLSGVASHPIVGHNVMYATHPYKQGNPQSEWGMAFGYLAAGNVAPVIVTEFGDNTTNCTGAWDTALTQYAAQPTLQISWTAWAWYGATNSCSFPALLDPSWQSPTVQGMAIIAALMNDPVPTPWISPPAMDSGPPDASDGASDAPLLSDGSAGDATTD